MGRSSRKRLPSGRRNSLSLSLCWVTRPPVVRRMRGKSDQDGWSSRTQRISRMEFSRRASSARIAAPAPRLISSQNSLIEATGLAIRPLRSSSSAIRYPSLPIGAKTMVLYAGDERSCCGGTAGLVIGSFPCNSRYPGEDSFKVFEGSANVYLAFVEHEFANSTLVRSAALLHDGKSLVKCASLFKVAEE